MDLRHLLTFRAVLREGSFLKAARALRLAQPTVTLHIQELEAELGLELFDRRGRSRPPTPAGEELAGRALPILDAVDSLTRSMAELRDGRSGLVRIASIEPTASRRVTPLLARLRRDRPAVRVRLDVSGTAGVSRSVADGDVDLGICSAPPAELGLRFEPLFSEAMTLLLPRSHRLARAKPLLAAALEGEPLLVSEQGCAYRAAIEAAFQKRGVRPRWVLETGSVETLRAAVRQGLGIALLPRLSASPPPEGTVARAMSDLLIALPVGFATRPDGAPAPPALAALIEALRRDLGPVTRSAGPGPDRERARAAPGSSTRALPRRAAPPPPRRTSSDRAAASRRAGS
jgi:LysR family transcriptional regulator, regulator of the ytmI operon